MADNLSYIPPKVWKWDMESGGMMGRAFGCGLMVLATVVSVGGPGARAELNSGGDYVALRLVGGVSAVDGVSDNGDSGTLEIRNDDDFVAGAGIAIGYDWSRNNLPVRTELEYTYRYRFDFDTRVNGGTGGTNSGVANNLSTHTVMLNAFYDIDTGTRIKPYAGAGIGWARNVSDANHTKLNILNFCCDETREDSRDNFAWSVQAGMVYRLADDWRIELGYRYIDLGEVDGGAFTTGTLISADDYTSHDVLFSVIYRFY